MLISKNYRMPLTRLPLLLIQSRESIIASRITGEGNTREMKNEKSLQKIKIMILECLSS